MNKRQVGTQYESMAVQYLTEAGYHILERNFRCRTGEIDIIASAACGSALEAVDYRKQQSILRVAQYYMVSHGYGTQINCRFDVVAIQGTEITLIQNAFGA